jgi:putative acetyltransferase
VSGEGGLRVRRGRLADAVAVAALMRASIRGLARAEYAPSVIARWSSLPALYHAWAMSAGGETYLVAERRGRIEGYAALRSREVTAVFVRPGAARRGTGLVLLRALERLARRRGARSLFARAALGAVGFYERAGFRRRGTGRVPLPGGGHLRAMRVEKPLRAPARTASPRGATSVRRGAGTGSAGRSPGRPAAGRRPRPRRSAPGPRARPSSARSTRASRRGTPRAWPGPRRR